MNEGRDMVMTFLGTLCPTLRQARPYSGLRAGSDMSSENLIRKEAKLPNSAKMAFNFLKTAELC